MVLQGLQHGPWKLPLNNAYFKRSSHCFILFQHPSISYHFKPSKTSVSSTIDIAVCKVSEWKLRPLAPLRSTSLPQPPRPCQRKAAGSEAWHTFFQWRIYKVWHFVAASWSPEPWGAAKQNPNFSRFPTSASLRSLSVYFLIFLDSKDVHKCLQYSVTTVSLRCHYSVTAPNSITTDSTHCAIRRQGQEAHREEAAVPPSEQSWTAWKASTRNAWHGSTILCFSKKSCTEVFTKLPQSSQNPPRILRLKLVVSLQLHATLIEPSYSYTPIAFSWLLLNPNHLHWHEFRWMCLRVFNTGHDRASHPTTRTLRLWVLHCHSCEHFDHLP